MSSPRVLIIGAGISGLALAQGLRRKGIDFAVFERDALLDSRLQGYRIKIGGQMRERLQALILDQAWHDFENTCATTVLGETNVNAPDGNILASRKGFLSEGESPPYTIDRGLMRRALMLGIDGFVHFGKQFVRYEIRDECVQVYFDDGSAEQGTLLIGADGARSTVRKQFLPDHKFVDTEACCIYGKTFLRSDLKARFPQKYRQWMTVFRDETPLIQSIIAGVRSDITMVTEPVEFPSPESRRESLQDYIHWGLVFPNTSCRLNEDSLTEELKLRPSQLALDITSQWHPSIRSLFELQDSSLTMGMRIFSATPHIRDWETSPQVALMGDAVHLMSPTGGVGALAALNDAATLTEIIVEHGVSSQSINQYEQIMKTFAEGCLRRSFVASEKMLGMPPVEKFKHVIL